MLKGFDIDRFKPRLMIIEANGKPQSDALEGHMRSFPYVRAIRLAVNDVYVRSDEPEFLEKLKWSQL